MPAEKRKSAFIRATQEAQAGTATTTTTNTVTPLQSETVVPSNRELIPQREASAGPKKDKKVTFYLTQEQEDKLDALEIEFRQRHKRKVNRNEIVRLLIDQCDIDSLAALASQQSSKYS